MAAGEAERAYAALAGELRKPRGTIDLVLYDNVDYPNGFANVIPSNRVGVFLAPPAGEIGLARYDEWMRLVITHELTHVFHLDRADGVWGVLQHVFGRAPLLFPNTYRPGWVVEGLATYYESALTGGGRVRGAFHTQLLTAAARAGSWPAPGDVNFTNARWPAALAPYAWGSRFFAREAAAHGDSAISRFVDRTSARLWPFGISHALSQSGGDLYRDWRAFRDDWPTGASADSRSTIIARGLRAEPRPHLSPDGGRLAYVANDGRTHERVVIRDLRAGKTVASRPVNGAPEIAWAGEDLLLAQLEYATPVEIRSSLHRWTADGRFGRESGTSRLVRPFGFPDARAGAVLLGPSRTSIVRVSIPSGLEDLKVPSADEWSHVAISPDGRYLAGARHASGQWDIVLWPAGLPDEVRLVTDDPTLDDEPWWSADGSLLVFTSERSGLPQIYGYRIASGETVRLTDEPTGAREGGVAADGTVYFSTLLADGYAVMSGRVESPARAVTSNSDPSLPGSLPVRGGAVTNGGTGDEIAGHAYSPFGSLLPRYWLPTVHAEGTVGRFVGVASSGSDVVGRTAYVADLAHAVDNARWEGFFGLAYSRWAALTIDASARQFWDRGGTALLGMAKTPVQVSERDGSIVAGVTLRHRWWRSEVGARLGGELSQDAFFVPDSFNVRFSNPALMGPVVSVFAGHGDRRPLSISTEDGVQISALYRRKWALDGSGRADEVRGSVRGFVGLPLPGFSRWVLAGRVSGARSGGPYRRRFAMGGESGSVLTVIPGLGFGAGFRDFGLRGYPPGGSQFTRVVVGSVELRVPLFLTGKAVWKLPLAVDRVSFSVFGETGGGWTTSSPARPTQYRDAGAELVIDVGLDLDVPLRVRLGGAQALATGLGANKGDWRWYVALGSSF
ncbi:MAG: PD40 domain-containing protein [Gemmatimonadetes bacterium]|nr:PD40 domain-containing protein [Gemmatimonadota bacterium]